MDAQTFVVSDAPSDGQWAENTHWYTIKNKKGGTYYYLSTASTHTDADGNLMIKGTARNIQGVWCVVADGNGYKFYNYAEGTGKVLGMTGDEKSGRAKMYDATATNTDVWTTFYYNSMINTAPDGNEANAFRIAETGNKYWNERDGYLAFWNDAKAVNGGNGNSTTENCVGSAYIFEEVTSNEILTLETSYYDDCASQVTTLLDNHSSHVGELFYLTQTSIDALTAAKPGTKPTDASELLTASRNMAVAINGCAYTLPAVGKRYAIKNVHNGSYVSMPITYGTDFMAASEIKRNVCWVLEAGASGSYRFRNAGTGYYMATDNFNPSVTAFDYSFYPQNGNTAIGNGTNLSAHKFLHMNPTDGIGWEASAGASRWTMTEITDEAYEALAAIPENEQSIGLKAQLIASKLPVTTDAYTAAKTAYEASKTLDNAKAFLNAAELCKYIRVQNVKREDLGLSVNASNANQAHGNTWSNADASLVWKLEFVDEANSDYRLKLHHLNTDKYLGAVTNVGTTSTAGMSDFTQGAVYTFTLSSDKFIIKDGNGSQMNCECNDANSIGNINCWNTTGDNSAFWHVIAATSIELPLTAIDGRAYATTCLPFPVSTVSEGVKAYKGQLNDDQTYIQLTELTDGIAKGEGVVLIADDAAATTTATLTISGSVEKASDNVFSGTTTAITLTDDNRANYRVMGRKVGDETSIGFFKPSASVSAITANRAYIDATGIVGQTLSVGFGTTDGIGETIVADAQADNATAVYDLSGRRVTGQLKSGLYIRGGKKVLVK